MELLKAGRLQMIEKSVSAIDHHYKCCNSSSYKSCQIISCKKIAKLNEHMHTCSLKESCTICKQFAALLKYHSKNCRDNGCEVLKCRDYKR